MTTRQTPNTSFLSPNKFRLVMSKFPTSNYFAKKVVIPSISVEAILAPSNNQYQWYVPGDKISHEDLIVTVFINEDMDTLKEMKAWLEEDVSDEEAVKKKFSQISIIPLNNNSNANGTINFEDAFPVSISGIEFDIAETENTQLTMDITFKFSKMVIKNKA